MASDSQADAGPQTEIIAKTEFDLPLLLPFIIPLALMVPAHFLVLGITSTVYLSLLEFAVVFFFLLVVRYAERRRALLDREGMTLSPLGIGRLRACPRHFRWAEVAEVRRTSFGTIQLRLNRPRKFRMFLSQPKNSIRIPKGIWTNPQFAETLRTSVPAERIHAEPTFDERLSWPVRHWWILAPVMLICAAAAAGCSFIAFRSPDFIGFLLRVSFELVILWLAVLLCADRARAAFRVVAGFLLTFVFTASSTIMEALLWSHGLKLIAGYWGALAGALVGAAIVVISSRKSRAGFFVGATFLLAAAGFWCGWAGFHQVAGIRLGVAWLDGRGPWTPSGDAFLMTEGSSVGFSDAPTTVCWYSSDSKLERRAVLPVNVRLLAFGQEAALFAVNRKEGSQLWFVPRHAEARVIDTATNYGRGNWISPDSRHTLIPIWDAEGKKIQAWKICDLETGKVEPVNFPVPLSEIAVIAPRDDGSVLWLSGSGPLDKENRPWPRANPVPESGEFPHPGKPYVVWSWKINSADAPAQLYAAKTQWLSWERSAKPERLHVLRVAESPPARTEYVELDLTRSPPTTEAISAAESGMMWRPPEDRSFDGRFAFDRGSAGRFAPGWIVDTKTGRKFGMVSRATAYNDASLWWSPGAHKFLVEVPELVLAGGRWHWRHMSEKMFDTAFVVYFVDMDRH